MGFRKALNSAPVQDAPTSCVSTGTLPMESLFPRDTESIQNGIGCSSLEQCLKGSKDSQLNTLSEPTSADENAYWHMKDKHEGKVSKESSQHLFLDSEKKSRNIGCKSKRLLIHSEDALKLRVTWEEAQDLLRPPPSVKPSIVLVENHEFEEYDEPPVFGKRTFFIAGLSGEQEQWTECDDCSKWRRLPLNVLLPPKWTCCENVWDLSRCSCTVPEEARPKELEKLFGMRKVSKKQRTSENRRPAQGHEPSGLDALATAAVLGDDEEKPGEVGAGAEATTTTKHPRHRSGCSCIVCIQPPSGKGKHKSTCACNVCTTVRRRFKTLMMRRRLRHSERDVVVEVPPGTEESDVDVSRGQSGTEANPSESERSQAEEAEAEAEAAGHIDLNCHPGREDELLHPEAVGGGGLSMVSLVKAARLPLDLYLKENGLTSLIQTQEAVLDGGSPPVTEIGDEEEEEQQPEEGMVTPATWEPSGGAEELCHEPGLD